MLKKLGLKEKFIDHPWINKAMGEPKKLKVEISILENIDQIRR